MKNSLILIAEDDADDCFLLQSAFAEKKYPGKIEFVENGVELMEFLYNIKGEKDKPDNYPILILLDLNMPKKDGREALQEIKQDEEFKKIPVFVFTTTQNEQEMAQDYGADRYLVKPVTFEGLLAVISEIQEFCSSIRSGEISQ